MRLLLELMLVATPIGIAWGGKKGGGNLPHTEIQSPPTGIQLHHFFGMGGFDMFGKQRAPTQVYTGPYHDIGPLSRAALRSGQLDGGSYGYPDQYDPPVPYHKPAYYVEDIVEEEDKKSKNPFKGLDKKLKAYKDNIKNFFENYVDYNTFEEHVIDEPAYAPALSYGPPKASYGPPKGSYGEHEEPSYGGHAPSYGQAQSYGAPAPSYAVYEEYEDEDDDSLTGKLSKFTEKAKDDFKKAGDTIKGWFTKKEEPDYDYVPALISHDSKPYHAPRPIYPYYSTPPGAYHSYEDDYHHDAPPATSYHHQSAPVYHVASSGGKGKGSKGK